MGHRVQVEVDLGLRHELEGGFVGGLVTGFFVGFDRGASVGVVGVESSKKKTPEKVKKEKPNSAPSNKKQMEMVFVRTKGKKFPLKSKDLWKRKKIIPKP